MSDSKNGGGGRVGRLGLSDTQSAGGTSGVIQNGTRPHLLEVALEAHENKLWKEMHNRPYQGHTMVLDQLGRVALDSPVPLSQSSIEQHAGVLGQDKVMILGAHGVQRTPRLSDETLVTALTSNVGEVRVIPDLNGNVHGLRFNGNQPPTLRRLKDPKKRRAAAEAVVSEVEQAGHSYLSGLAVTPRAQRTSIEDLRVEQWRGDRHGTEMRMGLDIVAQKYGWQSYEANIHQSRRRETVNAYAPQKPKSK